MSFGPNSLTQPDPTQTFNQTQQKLRNFHKYLTNQQYRHSIRPNPTNIWVRPMSINAFGARQLRYVTELGIGVYSIFYQLPVTCRLHTCYFFRCISFCRIERYGVLLEPYAILYMFEVVCKKILRHYNCDNYYLNLHKYITLRLRVCHTLIVM